MRLGELYDVCKKCYPALESFRKNPVRSQVYKVSDITDSIKDIDIFADIVKEMEKYKVSNMSEMRLNDFLKVSDALYMKVQAIIETCEFCNLNTEKNGIDIKLPMINDLTDFKNYIDDLEFVFTKCPFLQSEDEKLQFKSVDIGSTWIILAVTGASVAIGSVLLNNIAAFIDKCFVIKSHKLTCEKQKEEIKKNKLEQQEKDELIQSINRIYKITVDNAIEELEESCGRQIADGDERGRFEQSVERMNQLMDKGLQIYASINAPEETKTLFEPLEMSFLSVEEKLKRIEKKEDE